MNVLPSLRLARGLKQTIKVTPLAFPLTGGNFLSNNLHILKMAVATKHDGGQDGAIDFLVDNYLHTLLLDGCHSPGNGR